MTHLYDIALSLLPQIGPTTARALLARYGSAEAFFAQEKASLTQTSGLSVKRIQDFDFKKVLQLAEQEILFAEKEGIEILHLSDAHYPQRLKQCNDAPLLLYQQGTHCLNTPKALSFVGTRTATTEGKETCIRLIKEVAERFPDTVIFSGLAYGIDITAHLAALDHGLKTVGVLGHGLHMTYPASHQQHRLQLLKQGGAVLTEFSSSQNIFPKNFIQRNRIVAGISDATIIIESGTKGGSIFTAYTAHSYHRDVLAVPGRPSDKKSQGCNKLIKQNIAALIESAEDLSYALGWTESSQTGWQKKLLFPFSKEEQIIVDILVAKKTVHIDTLLLESEMSHSKLTSVLTQLELNDIIKPLPGKNYRLC